MTATLTKPRPVNQIPEVNNSRPAHRSFEFEEEELNPAIEELRPLCLKQRTDTLQWYRTLGKLVANHHVRVQKEREKYNDTMYGEHFFERIAGAIEVVSPLMLRMCFNLYYFYQDEASFRELANHKAISPTHALRLASINDGRLRRKLQDKVVEENLTVRELDAEIKRHEPKLPRKRGAGRPFKVPANLTRALAHMSAQSNNYQRAHEEVWFGDKYNIADVVPDLPASILTDDLRNQLEEALQGCESLISVAEAEAEQLREVLEVVDRRMAAQAECDRIAAEKDAA
jgi:hypothetical protein